MATKTGFRYGENHPNARYTDAEVENVRKLRDDGWGYKRIAAKMEMAVRTVRDYVNYTKRCRT
jgi:DNA-binding NarL/FixJ family response regulator